MALHSTQLSFLIAVGSILLDPSSKVHEDGYLRFGQRGGLTKVQACRFVENGRRGPCGGGNQSRDLA